jgi:hypothetical protein
MSRIEHFINNYQNSKTIILLNIHNKTYRVNNYIINYGKTHSVVKCMKKLPTLLYIFLCK